MNRRCPQVRHWPLASAIRKPRRGQRLDLPDAPGSLRRGQTGRMPEGCGNGSGAGSPRRRRSRRTRFMAKRFCGRPRFRGCRVFLPRHEADMIPACRIREWIPHMLNRGGQFIPDHPHRVLNAAAFVFQTPCWKSFLNRFPNMWTTDRPRPPAAYALLASRPCFSRRPFPRSRLQNRTAHGCRILLRNRAPPSILTLVLLGQMLEPPARGRTKQRRRPSRKLMDQSARKKPALIKRRKARRKKSLYRDVEVGDRCGSSPAEKVAVDGPRWPREKLPGSTNP